LVTIDAGENVLKFWDADTGRAIGRSTSSVDQLRGRCVHFSPNDKLIASGGVNGVARVWDGQTGQLIHELRAHEGQVTSVAFSTDGTRLFTVGHDMTMRVWNTETGKLLLTLRGHTDRVWALAVSPDGQKVASAGDDGTIHIWDASPQ
jgi:WD40 repeat protein